ncbi:MAG: hypothetical protein KKD39_07250 [Candidatus Altiarchaeota archaeon]|nr:hypothetical protein [Candidatus Altiarchaeota archaeon]
MDTPESIYSQILTSVSRHIHMVNPGLAQRTFAHFLKKLDAGGIKYKASQDKIEVLSLPQDSRKTLYNAIVALVEPFESKYGINETWVGLRSDLISIVAGIRQPLRLLDIEVPLSAYKMLYAFFDNLIAVNASGFRRIKWYEGVVTVTNHRILFQDGKEVKEIPLQTIATVGREIYLVYTGTTAKGIIKAIDYRVESRVGMSCALVLAKEDWMRDFVNTARIMRAEHRRLSIAEARVVVALYNEAGINELGQVCKVDTERAREAFNRLLKLKYINEKGHLTSHGINAAMEVLEREKLTKEMGVTDKDESGFKKHISREL